MIVVFLTFSTLGFAGEVNVKKLGKAKWKRVESTNFSVLSDASSKQIVLMLEELEGFNYFMSQVLGYQQKALEQKVPVILSKNSSSFSAMGVPSGYLGVFRRNGGSTIFARADKFRSSSKASLNWGRSTILHELVHLLNDNNSMGIASPPWFNEGVAEYFATFQLKKEKVILGDMGLLKHRFLSMRTLSGSSYESVDTESLFKTPQTDLGIADQRSKKQKRFVDKFYARSVGVVHYLFADKDRRVATYKYLKLIDKGYSVDEAFNYVFDMTFDELDTQVDDYLAGRHVYARVFPRGENGIEFPKVVTKPVETSQHENLVFLYQQISLFSDTFLGEGNREKMNNDFESLYPAIFE